MEEVNEFETPLSERKGPVTMDDLDAIVKEIESNLDTFIIQKRNLIDQISQAKVSNEITEEKDNQSMKASIIRNTPCLTHRISMIQLELPINQDSFPKNEIVRKGRAFISNAKKVCPIK